MSTPLHALNHDDYLEMVTDCLDLMAALEVRLLGELNTQNSYDAYVTERGALAERYLDARASIHWIKESTAQLRKHLLSLGIVDRDNMPAATSTTKDIIDGAKWLRQTMLPDIPIGDEPLSSAQHSALCYLMAMVDGEGANYLEGGAFDAHSAFQAARERDAALAAFEATKKGEVA